MPSQRRRYAEKAARILEMQAARDEQAKNQAIHNAKVEARKREKYEALSTQQQPSALVVSRLLSYLF